MSRYKSNPKLTMPQSEKKRHIERFMNALLDCLLIAGMILFLLLVTNCKPAHVFNAPSLVAGMEGKA